MISSWCSLSASLLWGEIWETSWWGAQVTQTGSVLSTLNSPPQKSYPTNILGGFLTVCIHSLISINQCMWYEMQKMYTTVILASGFWPKIWSFFIRTHQVWIRRDWGVLKITSIIFCLLGRRTGPKQCLHLSTHKLTPQWQWLAIQGTGLFTGNWCGVSCSRAFWQDFLTGAAWPS